VCSLNDHEEHRALHRMSWEWPTQPHYKKIACHASVTVGL